MIQSKNTKPNYDRFGRPLLGAHNPSSTAQGTTFGSFANRTAIGGPLTFSSPDTPGMPEPSPLTAWDFLPQGAKLDPSSSMPRCLDASMPSPVTQLESARLGIITEQMKRVAERETHLTAEQVRDEVDAGRMIITANTVHLS